MSSLKTHSACLLSGKHAWQLTRLRRAGRQAGQQVHMQAQRDAAGQQRQGGRHALAWEQPHALCWSKGF